MVGCEGEMPLRGGGWGASGATLDQYGDDWCRQCGDRKRELERELECGAADAGTWVSFTSNRLEMVGPDAGCKMSGQFFDRDEKKTIKNWFKPTGKTGENYK